MNWVSRKIYLYNVTMGLYVLDWWEYCLFNALILVLLWFMFYNGFRSAKEFFNRLDLFWALPLYLFVKFSIPIRAVSWNQSNRITELNVQFGSILVVYGSVRF
ncbi:hypothetical protein KSP40_PGU009856 [Platanthera guangdongensis]|uniref:Uncharacterized protein n=1 Tax=Platanthera guangdongensis TaxID=2320717 RepID=A0ABR2MLS8_9ASPA